MNNQLKVLFVMLGVYALCAFIVYAFFIDNLVAGTGIPMPESDLSPTMLGLANVGVVMVVYSPLALAGYWFARKLVLPGIYSEDGNFRRWFIIPLLVGLVCGAFVVVSDLLFAPINGFGRMVHPGFPVSILASLSASIGEEILTRSFVFGLWGFIINWLLKHFNGRTTALWIANIIAALAFAASHLGAIFVLTGATSIADLNPIFIVEIFVINGIVGLVAGERYMKDGLIAASGVHFWTDVVFHVMWGLF